MSPTKPQKSTREGDEIIFQAESFLHGPIIFDPQHSVTLDQMVAFFFNDPARQLPYQGFTRVLAGRVLFKDLRGGKPRRMNLTWADIDVVTTIIDMDQMAAVVRHAEEGEPNEIYVVEFYSKAHCEEFIEVVTRVPSERPSYLKSPSPPHSTRHRPKHHIRSVYSSDVLPSPASSIQDNYVYSRSEPATVRRKGARPLNQIVLYRTAVEWQQIRQRQSTRYPPSPVLRATREYNLENYGHMRIYADHTRLSVQSLRSSDGREPQDVTVGHDQLDRVLYMRNDPRHLVLAVAGEHDEAEQYYLVRTEDRSLHPTMLNFFEDNAIPVQEVDSIDSQGTPEPVLRSLTPGGTKEYFVPWRSRPTSAMSNGSAKKDGMTAVIVEPNEDQRELYPRQVRGLCDRFGRSLEDVARMGDAQDARRSPWKRNLTVIDNDGKWSSNDGSVYMFVAQSPTRSRP